MCNGAFESVGPYKVKINEDRQQHALFHAHTISTCNCLLLCVDYVVMSHRAAFFLYFYELKCLLHMLWVSRLEKRAFQEEQQRSTTISVRRDSEVTRLRTEV